MAINSKVFAEGQLASAKGTLVTFSAAAVGLQVTLCNTDASDRTAHLYLKPGSTSRKLCTVVLDASGGFATYQLQAVESGDVLEGYASAASVVDYTVTGGQAS